MGDSGSRPDGNSEVEIEELVYAFKPFTYDIQIDNNDSSPFARSGHRIVCDDDNFYSYGGYNPSQHGTEPVQANGEEDSLFPHVWKYNFATMKWKKLPVQDIPYALASNAVILSGKLLLVYGGTGVPFHLTKSNELFICNLADPELRFKKVETTGQAPPPLYGQAAFIKDNYFYVVGGTTGFDYFVDIHRLNLETKQWEEVYICKGLRNEPLGRYRHELAVVGNKVYILGGGNGVEAYDFEKIQVFDVVQKTWDIVLSIKDIVHGYPPPRQYHSSVNIPGTNSFIIVGGLGVEEGNVLDDAWKLDIPSMKWRNISSLKLCTPVYFHSSGITPSGKMYTFGGISRAWIVQERVAHVQSAWVCIPKLKDMCWEAVLDYGLLSELTSEDHKHRLPMEYYKKLDL